MRVRGLALAILCATVTFAESRLINTRIPSPDHAMMAVISTSTMTESRLEITTSPGKTLKKEDFTSDDGEHGYLVGKAKWTPDSQFFLFNLISSGGHSPTQSPVLYFSRKDGKMHDLGMELGDSILSTEPIFEVGVPDKVTVYLNSKHQSVTVSLASLKSAAGRKK